MTILESGLYLLTGIYAGVKPKQPSELLEIAEDLNLPKEEIVRIILLREPQGFGRIRGSYLTSYEISEAPEENEEYRTPKVSLGRKGDRLSLSIQLNPGYELVHNFLPSQC